MLPKFTCWRKEQYSSLKTKPTMYIHDISMVIFVESGPKHSVEIYVLMQVVKTYACLIGRERNSPSHVLYLYIFKNVQPTHIKILLEMKGAQTAQKIRKVPLEKVHVRVMITIIAFKDIIIHNHVTVSMQVSHGQIGVGLVINLISCF